MEYQCRICLTEEKNTDDLIRPCKCNGSVKYIHRKCLDEWRSASADNDNFNRCQTCKFKYVILNKDKEKQTKKKYENAVRFDKILISIIIIIIVILFTFLIWRSNFLRYIPFTLKNNIYSCFFSSIFIICFIAGILSIGDMNMNGFITHYDICAHGIIKIVNCTKNYIDFRKDYHKKRIILKNKSRMQNVKDFKNDINF
jgi:hypothetical protein